MHRSICWVACLCLGATATIYATLALTFDAWVRSGPAFISVQMAAQHRLLFLLAMLVYALLALLVLARPRLAGATGFAAYFVIVVLLLVFAGDRAKTYNQARGLRFGDAGHVFPLQLITSVGTAHLLLLGLPIVAMSGGIVHAKKARRESLDDATVEAYLAAQAR